jgi:hypothetical protein
MKKTANVTKYTPRIGPGLKTLFLLKKTSSIGVLPPKAPNSGLPTDKDSCGAQPPHNPQLN